MNNTVDVNKICRLCLADEEVNVPIFDGKDKEEEVYLKISTCLPVQVSRDDSFPKKICDDCSDKVNIMYRLWNTSASSEKKLSEWLEQWNANNKNTDFEIIDLTDLPFETLSDGGLSEITAEESCIDARDTQDASDDKLNQDDYIEEQLPQFTTVEIVEEEPCKTTTDVQDLQNDSLNQDVSIEELPHSTTLEIVYSNTPEETLEDEQEDIWEQELELSSAELPSSTTLETVSSEEVDEVQPITTCIVPTCDGNKDNTKKVFHPLPANEEIRKIWLKLISRRDLLEKPYDDLQQARVCGAHFDEAQYSSKTKKFHCIAANCNGITNNNRRTWHSIPKDSEMREKWLSILKRPDLQDATNPHNKVCGAHFASWQFRSPVSENLNFRSVPLFLKDESETSNATTSPPVILPEQPPTPTKQDATPTKQNATPTKQNATPTKQNATPKKQNVTPTKQNATPTKQNATPEKSLTRTTPEQNATPGKQLITEKKRFHNSVKRLATTPKQIATPGKQLATSRKRLATTPEQNATPTKQNATAEKPLTRTTPEQNATPEKQLITEKKGLDNLVKRLATTLKQVATPGKQLATSRKRLATTPEQNATPEKQLITVKKRIVNPVKQNTTPGKQLATSKKRLTNNSTKSRYLLRRRN